MNFGFLVTDLAVKKAPHATIRLAREATLRGHHSWLFTPGDFAFFSDDRLYLLARRVPRTRYKSNETYLNDLLHSALVHRLAVRDLDLIMLRDNPAKYGADESWARPAGSVFGRAACREGVVVVNDPEGLARASDKLYFQFFPRQVRPRTLITRRREDVKEFAAELDGDLILKPLRGCGGEGVFMVKKEAEYNLNQLVDTLLRSGYLVAQEYLPAAQEGDVRMLVMNGRPIKVKGRYAALRRAPGDDDIRSNISAGGLEVPVEITPTMLELAELVRPKLVEDGIFLAGLDICGDKLMEVNVFCPGGLSGMERLEGVNFSAAVVDAMEQKVQYASCFGPSFDNRLVASL